jgi:glutamate--cysteine ligase catalytic subunit
VSVEDFLTVEDNMKKRRKVIQARLTEGEELLAVTTFPLLGAKNFLYPHYEPKGEASHSLFIPDEAINTHPRFA